MIDQRLLSTRENYHIKIRRQDFEDKLLKKRFQFIQQQKSDQCHMNQQQHFQSLERISNIDFKTAYQLSMNLQFIDFRCAQHKNQLDIIVKFIVNSKLKAELDFDQKLVLNQITNYIRLILIKITSYDDVKILPYLTTIYEFLKVQFQLKIIYNIACIIQWNSFFDKRQLFMELFLENINKKQSFYTDEDISIINGFSQLKLKQYYCFNFIGIINRYLAFNINNTLEQKGLINTFDALRRMCKINIFETIFSQLTKSEHILQQITKQLQSCKSDMIVNKVCLLLSELAKSPKYLQQIINKQCTIFILLLQIPTKHKTTQIIKQSDQFRKHNIETQLSSHKLCFQYQNNVTSADDLSQYDLSKHNKELQKPSFDLYVKLNEAILTMIELDLVDQNGNEIISNYLINKYGLMEYLEMIIYNQNHDLQSKATYIKQLIDPCLIQ